MDEKLRSYAIEDMVTVLFLKRIAIDESKDNLPLMIIEAVNPAFIIVRIDE